VAETNRLMHYLHLFGWVSLSVDIDLGEDDVIRVANQLVLFITRTHPHLEGVGVGMGQ
jgi:hypothetical protein